MIAATDPGPRRRVLIIAAILLASLVCSTCGPPAVAPERDLSPEALELSSQAIAAGFVDVRTIIPDAIVELRYATNNNFIGSALYPSGARCLVHESLAAGLIRAAQILRAHGDRLVFWDCYRPHQVQVRMFEAVPDPVFVARPQPYSRSHEAGQSIDVTLASSNGMRVDMGTDFDDFSPKAGAYSTAVSQSAQANRTLLRNAMVAGGFKPYDAEWWHFDGPEANVERPIVDVPMT